MIERQQGLGTSMTRRRIIELGVAATGGMVFGAVGSIFVEQLRTQPQRKNTLNTEAYAHLEQLLKKNHFAKVKPFGQGGSIPPWGSTMTFSSDFASSGISPYQTNVTEAQLQGEPFLTGNAIVLNRLNAVQMPAAKDLDKYPYCGVPNGKTEGLDIWVRSLHMPLQVAIGSYNGNERVLSFKDPFSPPFLPLGLVPPPAFDNTPPLKHAIENAWAYVVAVEKPVQPRTFVAARRQLFSFLTV